jgi:hypothetical protein
MGDAELTCIIPILQYNRADGRPTIEKLPKDTYESQMVTGINQSAFCPTRDGRDPSAAKAETRDAPDRGGQQVIRRQATKGAPLPLGTTFRNRRVLLD